MRAFAIVVLTACGSAGAPTTTPTSAGAAASTDPAKRSTPAIERPVIDPLVALTPTTDGNTSMLQPGVAQLELHATPIESPGATAPLQATIIAEQGSLVRVTIRLKHARFVVWTERARLFAILTRDERVARGPGQSALATDKHVLLRAGTAVRRLAKKDTWVQIRYSGALEVDGWVPDAALAEEGPWRVSRGRIPTGRKTLMVTPGAVIRFEPKWAARQLAVMANGYFLDTVREVDDAWSEISYADGNVAVTGYVSRRDPPGRVHHKRPDPSLAPAPIVPNTKVPSGTCLHAGVDGDPIGYLVGDQDVDLADLGRGWWTVTIDSPWGPIPFAARGADPLSLVSCSPDKTIPGSTLGAPPPAPPTTAP